jgi:flagellar basal body-associated protein FliL
VVVVVVVLVVVLVVVVVVLVMVVVSETQRECVHLARRRPRHFARVRDH